MNWRWRTRQPLSTVGDDQMLVKALLTAARNGVVLKVNRGSALDGWLAARSALMRVLDYSETEVASDQAKRADLYERLLFMSPAIFRTRGELHAARSELRAMGWGDHLLPDMNLEAADMKPLNRAERRLMERRVR